VHAATNPKSVLIAAAKRDAPNVKRKEAWTRGVLSVSVSSTVEIDEAFSKRAAIGIRIMSVT
ncbi:MAG: hypothetical protein ACK528_03705, partial [Alphaproteobacteria bacterium]